MILSEEGLGREPATDGELRQVLDGGVHQLHHALLLGVLLRPGDNYVITCVKVRPMTRALISPL